MFRIRVYRADDNAFDSRRNDGVRAGWRAAVCAARFECHVKRRTSGIVAALLRVAKRLNFRMGFACAPMPAAPDDFSAFHQHRANHRVGRSRAVAALRQTQSRRRNSDHSSNSASAVLHRSFICRPAQDCKPNEWAAHERPSSPNRRSRKYSLRGLSSVILISGSGLSKSLTEASARNNQTHIGRQVSRIGPIPTNLFCAGGHKCRQLFGRSPFNGVHGGQDVDSPSFNGRKTTPIRERVAYGAQNGLGGQLCPAGEPGLEYAVWFQMLFDQIIKLRGIEEAGSGGFHWRWRIDHDDIKFFPGASEETPPIVNDDMSFGIAQNLRRIGVIKSKSLRHTRHQFHRRCINIPAQSRTISCTHAETNNQCRFRFSSMKGQR